MNDPTPAPVCGTPAPRYYVDFFDVFDAAFREGNLGDGWGIWGFWPERLFDSLDEARACRDKLNAELAEENRALGEHYGILDGAAGGEIERVMRQR